MRSGKGRLVRRVWQETSYVKYYKKGKRIKTGLWVLTAVYGAYDELFSRGRWTMVGRGV